MLLDADEIRSALVELARRLTDAGLVAGIRLVGGAALAIEYYDRAATRDVDAIFHPAEDVMAHAREIARERGWPEDWLNSKAGMFMSDFESERDWKTVIEDGNVTVRVASAELLLAMKLLAGRGRRDVRDIEVLLGECNVTSLDDVQAIFDRYYPQDGMKPRAVRLVTAWLEEDAASRDRGSP